MNSVLPHAWRQSGGHTVVLEVGRHNQLHVLALLELSSISSSAAQVSKTEMTSLQLPERVSVRIK